MTKYLLVVGNGLINLGLRIFRVPESVLRQHNPRNGGLCNICIAEQREYRMIIRGGRYLYLSPLCHLPVFGDNHPQYLDLLPDELPLLFFREIPPLFYQVH